MGIISKEHADQVQSFSFADSNASAAEASSWSLAAQQPDALPGPQPAQELTGEPTQQHSPEPSPGSDVQAAAHEPQGAPELVQPVFQVPEETLGQFYEQGLLAGQEEGKNLVFAELTILQERFAGALDNLVGVSRELSSQNQIQVMTLACQIAETLLRGEFKTNPARLVDLIRDAISKQTSQSEVLVRCSPGDFEYISGQKPHLVDGLDGAFSVRIEENPELEYGDFQIETKKGQIDGRLSTRLDEVQNALEGDGHV
ncbi:MAG: FliH/SctL family protein [Myxococcota bacterium]|nr:FliH/SctL family protein [Myxococcota bacterium]